MPHDIIDNRDQKLVDHINSILGSTDSARFAVGYFIDGPRKSDHWLRDKNRWLEEVKKTTTNHRNES